MNKKILIGIDTGVNTGFAVAIDVGNGGDLQKVECLSITQAMANINELVIEHGKENIKLYIEDARCPTWEEMCFIKSLFWSEDDCVIQYHPPKSDYVNNHPFCLHLWRPTEQTLPTPPSFMVGKAGAA